MDRAPFCGVRERRGTVNRSSSYRQREGYFHTGKSVSVTDTRCLKIVMLRALMALGIIANVRGRGVLEFAEWLRGGEVRLRRRRSWSQAREENVPEAVGQVSGQP